jgi:hypothetical protein
MVSFLFVALYHPAIQYKSEVGVLVVMPVHPLMRIFRIGERKAAMSGRFISYPVKLARLQCIHCLNIHLNAAGFDGLYTVVVTSAKKVAGCAVIFISLMLSITL